jgi:hypothetical protein
MTPLRQRMIEDMQVRNLAPHTQAIYVLHVSLFARHFRQSPELLGPEDIRDYQLSLTNQRKLAPSSIVVTTAGLRFLYNVTRMKGWNLAASIPPNIPRRCRLCSAERRFSIFSAVSKTSNSRRSLRPATPGHLAPDFALQGERPIFRDMPRIRQVVEPGRTGGRPG